MQSWDSYCADPKNRTQVTLSVRLLADKRLSSNAKVLAGYMTLRHFDATEVENIFDFFNGSFGVKEIFDSALELYNCGYTTVELYEETKNFTMSLKPCATCMPWSEK